MTSEVLVFACTECGCENVQGTAWVYLNNYQLIDCEPPSDALWCPNCNSETVVGLFDRNDLERKDTWHKGQTIPVFEESKKFGEQE